MSELRTFRLPDLGEGLPDATIVEWLVKPGDTIALDAPLISMETAKAIVEVPSPYSGKLVKVYGSNGDVIATGAPLADFEIDANAPQRAEAHSTGHHAAPAATPAASSAPASTERPDTGTVVGEMQASDRVVVEAAVAVGGIKAVPAVRALAKKLGIDLARVAPSGAGGVVTLKDVRDFAARPDAKSRKEEPPPVRAETRSAASAPTAAEKSPAVPRAAASSVREHDGYGEPQQLKGVRRNMARVMADALAKVVPTTLNDDADIHAWRAGEDVSVRLLRSITAACKAVPALNAWFDGENLTRSLHERVDIGVAVDTVDGLFVPALRNADTLDARGLRAALDDLMRQVRDRSIPPSELSGYTISLSNFGVFAGRYATPIVVPPTVAIVAAGKLRHQAVPVIGGIETHRVIPLSLTFDHRACTGGEAARFLKAMLDDLTLPE
ncbi:MAG: 2-oxo acid dehydrogenase subunit E2 [Rudaea sp.]|uniref:dihydrolipoamide acetyltransferase family protein n=1 Tax=unclassified Rudaea TaxID=2627037 RepID=UPI0010FA3AE7|nr:MULTISPECIES: dihydrolipoamide acetyltransferase family protein [unclassified Rudaea]MBN8885754.1 2-oxo acid dehydrogenase subunit E2 [Rudaea sp.]